jgi:F420H(2)-dependent quinone reductase
LRHPAEVKARARTAMGDERTRLWKKVLEFLAALCRLSALKTEREIPVVILEQVRQA